MPLRRGFHFFCVIYSFLLSLQFFFSQLFNLSGRGRAWPNQVSSRLAAKLETNFAGHASSLLPHFFAVINAIQSDRIKEKMAIIGATIAKRVAIHEVSGERREQLGDEVL